VERQRAGLPPEAPAPVEPGTSPVSNAPAATITAPAGAKVITVPQSPAPAR
jgi:hypothetical protein